MMLILMSYPVTRGLLRHGVCGVAFMALLLVPSGTERGPVPIPVPRALERSPSSAHGHGRPAAVQRRGACGQLSGYGGRSVFLCALSHDLVGARSAHNGHGVDVILTSFHLGLHGHGVWRNARLWTSRIWPFVVLAFFALGTALFAHSGLWNVMLMNGIPQTRLAGLPLFLAYYPAMTLWLCLLARGAWSFMGKPCFRNGC